MTLERECKNPSHKSWEFWRLCVLTQSREFEVDLLKKDYLHAMKELTDMATVAADCIRHMGSDFWMELTHRVAENAIKSGVFDRDEAFYREKLLKEESTILGMGGKLSEHTLDELVDCSSVPKKCAAGCGLCGN